MKLKQNVYTATLSSERGYTFLSALLTITILLITIPFLSYLFKAEHFSNNSDALSVHHFFHFLQQEVKKATEYYVINDKLTIVSTNEEQITFEKYGSLIIRRVKDKGHEIYLRNVEDIKVKTLDYGIHVTIQSKIGEFYEKEIIFYQ